MIRNVGTIDRILRVGAGCLLAALGLVGAAVLWLAFNAVIAWVTQD